MALHNQYVQFDRHVDSLPAQKVKQSGLHWGQIEGCHILSLKRNELETPSAFKIEQYDSFTL